MKNRIRSNFKRLYFEKQAKDQRKLSYRIMAEEADLSLGSVKSWMNEEYISRFDSDTVCKICAYLECSLCDLLEIEEVK